MIFSQDLFKKMVVLVIIFVTFSILHLLTQNTLEKFFTFPAPSKNQELQGAIRNIMIPVWVYSYYEKQKSHNELTISDFPPHNVQSTLPLTASQYTDAQNICFLLNDSDFKTSLIEIAGDGVPPAAAAAAVNDMKTFSNVLVMINTFYKEGLAVGTSPVETNAATNWLESPNQINGKIYSDVRKFDDNGKEIWNARMYIQAIMGACAIIGNLYTTSLGYKSSAAEEDLLAFEERMDEKEKHNAYFHILYNLNDRLLLQSVVRFAPQNSSVFPISKTREILQETYNNFRETLNWGELKSWTLILPPMLTRKSVSIEPEGLDRKGYEWLPINSHGDALSYTIHLKDDEQNTEMGYIESVVVKSDWHTMRPTKIKVMDSELAWDAEESFVHDPNICGHDGLSWCKAGKKSLLKVMCPAERKIPSGAVKVQIFKQTADGDPSSVVLHEIIVNYIVV